MTAVSGSATASFFYDGDGQRVKGTVGGVTTAYVGAHYEWTGSTTTAKRYYFAGSQLVAMRVGPSTLHFLLGDHLGSTSLTTNSTGGLLAELRYKPWGETRHTSGTTPTRVRFTGQHEESGLGGLYFYDARWYDPAVSRFVSADTLVPEPGNPQAFNRYAYVNNSPINHTDPTGHCIDGISTWICVGAAVGAAIAYGVQVHRNAENGLTGIEALTTDISLYQIGTGAVVGAAAVALAPVAIAAAGDVLVGAGLLTGSSTLFSAGTAAYGASAAVASAVYGIKSATSLPTLEVDSNRMPNIADNIRNAQANGAPTTLTRTQNTALIDANRAAATAGFTGPGSPDEYPFASTYEGGAGAFVRGFPLAEQRVQRGVISRFYQDNGIVDGSKFHVRVK